jgi:release factor glutamine methyltransferase
MPTGALDARVLLLAAAGIDHASLIANDTHPVASDIVQRFDDFLGRRRDGEPVAYITGRQEFFGREFLVTPQVLIPRPETEMLVEAALRLDLPTAQIVDLGTGSGCLLATLLAERPSWRGTGVDLSAEALAVAAQNLTAHGVNSRAELVAADFAEPLGRQYDVVVANPPYIADNDPVASQTGRYEPHLALYAGADGLEAYRRLAPRLDDLLSAQGQAFIEIGSGQGAAVTTLLADHLSGRQVSLRQDLAGLDRMVHVGPSD